VEVQRRSVIGFAVDLEFKGAGYTGPPVVAPIVEGHGEVKAVQVLVSRIGLELLGGAAYEAPARR
jgi:hypothetical protein